MCLVVACPFLVAAAAIAYHLPDPALPSEGDEEDQGDSIGEAGCFDNPNFSSGKEEGLRFAAFLSLLAVGAYTQMSSTVPTRRVRMF